LPKKKRHPRRFLISLVRKQFPQIDEPEELISGGQILVDGATITNIKARVPADAAIKVLKAKPLRGTVKLAHAIATFGLDLTGFVAVDVGAAAGGFTQALLDAGVARVYAVDAGVGQLRGWLRADHRVINLEHTNLGRLGPSLVPEPADVVVMDLSYLSIADAVPQLDQLNLATETQLIALVKPTFELHRGQLAADPGQVASAAAKARRALRDAGWAPAGQVASPIDGSRGAVEVLLLAKRGGGPTASGSPAERG
jgi:23S rRNA (cytidine1920-2'-O)/16S rRNA (cytidine1409-2'-O)-methyltransferase